MGYELALGGSYENENFPGSAQTQVTGLNNTCTRGQQQHRGQRAAGG